MGYAHMHSNTHTHTHTHTHAQRACLYRPLTGGLWFKFTKAEAGEE